VENGALEVQFIAIGTSIAANASTIFQSRNLGRKNSSAIMLYFVVYHLALATLLSV